MHAPNGIHPTGRAREGAPRAGAGSPRRRRRLTSALVAGAACLGLGLALALGPDTDAPPARLSASPADVPATLVKAPLADEARRVAMRFIQTAVAREHLGEAWTLVGPQLRGGLTRAEWMTGENPVVPYPVDELEVAPYKVDASYTRSALLEVALLPRKGSGVRSQVFFLELLEVGAPGRSRWVVDNWVPRASAVTPR